MAKIVIALWGPANSGKSKTIRKVMNLAKSKWRNSKVLYEKQYWTDATLILMVGRVKIGFESQGDPGSRLEDSLELFLTWACKVIVCATRTRGQTVNVVEALKRKNYKAEWIEKIRTKPAHQEASNAKTAKEIIEKVDQIIGQ